jgi:hypothetical protein
VIVFHIAGLHRSVRPIARSLFPSGVEVCTSKAFLDFIFCRFLLTIEIFVNVKVGI